MFQALLALVDEHVGEKPLRELVRHLLEANEPELKRWPAASRYHHAYIGGFLEHVLSVTRTAAHLAQKYCEMYPRMCPALSTDLVVAGAVLHDIGKLRELDGDPAGARYTPVGNLLGHILLGRDMVREAAAKYPAIAPETLLRLEHAIVAHHGTGEFGSPKEPQTPEALLIHHADEIDAKFRMVAAAWRATPSCPPTAATRSRPATTRCGGDSSAGCRVRRSGSRLTDDGAGRRSRPSVRLGFEEGGGVDRSCVSGGSLTYECHELLFRQHGHAVQLCLVQLAPARSPATR